MLTWLLRIAVALSLALMSFSGRAEALSLSTNCININDDLELISRLTDTGALRKEANKFPIDDFDFRSNVPYSDYLAYARNKILADNPKAEMLCPIKTKTSEILYPDLDNDLQQVVDLIAPFELSVPNSSAVVLLIHGLTDSPYLFHDLAHEFYLKGLNVRTLMLPGHGTAPSALIETSERQWRRATEYAMRAALKDFDKVYLGGFSTGGALIWDQLSHGNWSASEIEKIAGLMMWAPATKAKSNLAWIAKYMNYVPFVDWVNKGADIDFAKYESFPFNAAAQINKLMSRINGESKSLRNIPDIPLFVVASEVDQTIDTKTTLKLIKRWHTATGRTNQSRDTLIYYGSDSRINNLPKTFTVATPSCQSQQLCGKVINISHNAAMNSPKNPHYGNQGNYKYCEHHIGSEAFSACKSMTVVPTGEITSDNLSKYGVLRRLTYNPYFEHMSKLVGDFITNTQ